jgi:hypothetical protein
MVKGIRIGLVAVKSNNAIVPAEPQHPSIPATIPIDPPVRKPA